MMKTCPRCDYHRLCQDGTCACVEVPEEAIKFIKSFSGVTWDRDGTVTLDEIAIQEWFSQNTWKPKQSGVCGMTKEKLEEIRERLDDSVKRNMQLVCDKSSSDKELAERRLAYEQALKEYAESVGIPSEYLVLFNLRRYERERQEELEKHKQGLLEERPNL